MTLAKRASDTEASSRWHLSQLSFLKDVAFNKDNGKHKPSQEEWLYSFDDSLGQGQTIFILDDGFQQLAVS